MFVFLIVTYASFILAYALAGNAASLSHFAKRRFAQENPPVLNEVRALEQLAGTNNGKFLSLAGKIPTLLIAKADACARYKVIEEIVNECKGKPCEKQAILVGTKLAAAEKNFNIDNGKGKPSFCNDPSIPSIPELRCIVTIIDPGFKGATEFNQKVNARLAQIQASPNPQLCVGQSVQQQALALGVTGCVGCDGSTPASSNPPPTNSTSSSNVPAKKCRPKA